MKIDLLSNLKKVNFNNRFSSNPMCFKGKSDSVKLSEITKYKSNALAQYQEICTKSDEDLRKKDVEINEVAQKEQAIQSLLKAFDENKDLVSDYQKAYEESIEQHKPAIHYRDKMQIKAQKEAILEKLLSDLDKMGKNKK